MTITLRICTKCKRELPATAEYFQRQKSGKDGFHSWCKQCKQEYARSYNGSYYEKNREVILQKTREYHQRTPEKQTERQRRYYAKHKEAADQRVKANERRARQDVLVAYGPKCVCCGETHVEFLCIDHINGGGRRHRTEIGGNFYRWLRKNNYPPEFRVLCHNCNMAMGFYGHCPHQQGKE